MNFQGVRDGALASCLGNGCSVTVLAAALIPEVLHAINLINKKELNLLRQRAEVHRRLSLGM